MFDILLKGTVSAAEEFLLLPILEKIVNDSEWSVCNGVSNCSYYCHYKIHDSVPMFFPTNSVRDKDCPKLFKPASNRSQSCHLCLSLQYYLSSRKQHYDLLSDKDRLKRQSASSTLPIDYLSPSSKYKRIDNMKIKIKALSQKIRFLKEHALNISDEQSDELTHLVKAISESEVGNLELKKIYDEANAIADGGGEMLKSIWDGDTEIFYNDQQKNGRFLLLHEQLTFCFHSNWKSRQ